MLEENPRAWPKVVAAVVSVLVLLAGAFWAGRVTVGSGEPAADAPAEVLAEVRQASVGRVLRLNTTVRVPRVATAEAELGGIVTAVSRSGRFEVGERAYAVDGVAVRVVAGTFPFYRDLAAGDRGRDVGQLTTALRTLGYLRSEPGTAMTTEVVAALICWQRDSGARADGTVRLGELVAAGRLPGRLWVDSDVAAVGRRLATGSVVVSRPGGDPRFSLELSTEQAAEVTADAGYVVTTADERWPAIAESTSQLDDGRVAFALTAPDGGVVCADRCDRLPSGEQLFLLTEITVVPPTDGPAVPVAALRTQPDGSVGVLVADGTSRRLTPVKVLASRDGIAVVEGLEVGQQVQLFGATPQPVPTTATATGTPR